VEVPGVGAVVILEGCELVMEILSPMFEGIAWGFVGGCKAGKVIRR